MPTEHEREITKQAMFQAFMTAAAEQVVEHARDFERAAHGPWMPPRGSRSQHTIRVVRDGDDVYAANFDHAAAIIEYGSKNNPAHATLRRAALAAKLEFRSLPHP